MPYYASEINAKKVISEKTITLIYIVIYNHTLIKCAFQRGC